MRKKYKVLINYTFDKENSVQTVEVKVNGGKVEITEIPKGLRNLIARDYLTELSREDYKKYKGMDERN